MLFTLSGCINAGSASDSNTVAMIPGFQGGGAVAQPVPQGYPAVTNTIQVTLGDTSPTQMYVHLSQPYVPEGPVTFIITNESTTMEHELVGFSTKTLAADFPITGFEGDPDKIDEDKAGTVILDTGASLKPGAIQMITTHLKAGHDALVCNLSGHYKAGMHVDLWVTPKGSTPVLATMGDTSPTQMYVHLSQPYVPAGPVTFIITNASTTMEHELVGFATPTMAADFPITGFEGSPDKIDEDKAGTSVLDTGAALKPGATQMITTDLKAGHDALVCNLSGHYRAGMHVDLWVTPAGSTPVLATLGDTSATAMYVHLSQPYVPAGPVTFIITNESTTMEHELVGFATKTMAADFPITGFEGSPDKMDEAKAGKVILDTGAALKPGATQMVTTDLKAGHDALVCNLSGHYRAGMHVDLWVTPAGSTPVLATLGDTSPTVMYVHLSQPYVPAGPVTFIITNESTTMDHELVGFSTKTMAADFPITGFEGSPDKIDEAKAGPVILDTGASLKPGATQMITTNLKAGHDALVCNLSGHYRAGMHVDLWVTPAGSTPVAVTMGDTTATQMYVHLSQPYVPAGPVTFIITNESTDMEHELVGFSTKTLAADFPITGFEGSPDKIDEAKAGKVVLDTGASLKPGATQMVTTDLKAGHDALVCNLSGHYRAGMHVDLWVTPLAAIA